ncbi:MAG: hypothetical protein ACHQ16_08475 [Candidatus Lutacidiplasmatales archaeon]
MATKDVDVLIDGSDWAQVDTAIERRDDATALQPYRGTIRGTVVVIGGAKIDLEFLSDAPFSGTQAPGSFVRYVRDHGSVLHEGVRYATPAVVFYMRLSAPESWESYIPIIGRDIASGVPLRTLMDAVAIAARFGVEPRTRERIDFVRTLLRYQ